MIGEKFTRLTIIAETRSGPKNRLAYVCLCDCGEQRTVLKENLVTGRQKSCGCLSKELAKKTGERSKTHGMHNTRVYRIWSQMKRRCQIPSNGAYERYGAKGVTVCEEWQKFENFYKDMGDDNGLTIDRINNELGYSKDNCRWATWSEQAKNRTKGVRHGN